MATRSSEQSHCHDALTNRHVYDKNLEEIGRRCAFEAAQHSKSVKVTIQTPWRNRAPREALREAPRVGAWRENVARFTNVKMRSKINAPPQCIFQHSGQLWLYCIVRIIYE